jgi:hypothetical protein
MAFSSFIAAELAFRSLDGVPRFEALLQRVVLPSSRADYA